MRNDKSMYAAVSGGWCANENAKGRPNQGWGEEIHMRGRPECLGVRVLSGGHHRLGALADCEAPRRKKD